MDSPLDQSSTDSRRETPPVEIKAPKDEKIDIDIGDIIRCNMEDVPRIIRSYSDWARQWE